MMSSWPEKSSEIVTGQARGRETLLVQVWYKQLKVQRHCLDKFALMKLVHFIALPMQEEQHLESLQKVHFV